MKYCKDFLSCPDNLKRLIQDVLSIFQIDRNYSWQGIPIAERSSGIVECCNLSLLMSKATLPRENAMPTLISVLVLLLGMAFATPANGPISPTFSFRVRSLVTMTR